MSERTLLHSNGQPIAVEKSRVAFIKRSEHGTIIWFDQHFHVTVTEDFYVVREVIWGLPVPQVN